MHELPSLKYKYSDLEPYFDEETMRIHHTKHHQTYVDKLNTALEPYPDLAKLSIEDLLRNLSVVPEPIKPAVVNNGGGHYNHSLFWETLSPSGGKPREKTITLIDRDFGGLENFRTKFKELALNRFGSGWAWLAQDVNGKLALISNPNQDNAIMNQSVIPNGPFRMILGVDVWEHAYYLKYQNRRAEYVDAFWHVVNWQKVEDMLK